MLTLVTLSAAFTPLVITFWEPWFFRSRSLGHEVGGDQTRTEKKFIYTHLSGSLVQEIAFVLHAK